MQLTQPAAPLFRHRRFVKTPLIEDVLHLQAYQRGQWVRLAWCDRPSRFYGFRSTGTSYNVTAFHYPNAHGQFVSYCHPERRRVAA